MSQLLGDTIGKSLFSDKQREIFKRPHQSKIDRGTPANYNNLRDDFIDDHIHSLRAQGIQKTMGMKKFNTDAVLPGEVNRFSSVLGQVEESPFGRGGGNIFDKEVIKRADNANTKFKSDISMIQASVGNAPRALRKKLPLQQEINTQAKNTGQLSSGLRQKINAFLSK